MSSMRDCAVAGRPASILSTLCVGRRLFSLLLTKAQQPDSLRARRRPRRHPGGENARAALFQLRFSFLEVLKSTLYTAVIT